MAFFDSADLRRARDLSVAVRLRQRDAAVSWDVTNQAAAHLWYPERFGSDVAPFGSVAEAHRHLAGIRDLRGRQAQRKRYARCLRSTRP